MKPCPTCGGDVIVDFRAQRTYCGSCERSPRFCTCSPVSARQPVWLRHLKAKELTGSAA